MNPCPTCGADTPDAARYCPECGAAVAEPAASPTRTAPQAARTPGAGGSSSAESSGGGDRFLPGTLLAGRYRIVSQLGKGGMGEVYRADDLRLGQAVALKFLPAAFEQDVPRLTRLLNEVRIARQVTHVNVCRVYDVADAGALHFISMEYVDGEDLEALLRRIGRLPAEKAVQIARELCAGLAAAHEQGIVHRDLKPANVMLDGRGRVRITDFGIAGLAREIAGPESRSGTPAYMAPELWAGGEASIRSDLYSLGLVLYELFTGQRAFRGDTLAELRRMQEASAPAPLSDVVGDLDPAVERIILRCLDTDPDRRPPSAIAVAAALPGGDPLAMALAAGETPSPALVAAAGEAGGLSPRIVRWLLPGLLVATVALFWLAGHAGLLLRIERPKSTAVLVDRAQGLLRAFGFEETPTDFAYGYGWHRSYLEQIRDGDASPGRWNVLSRPRPTILFLWYRQSPRWLIPGNAAGIVDGNDPPPLTPGMISIWVTASGDLWQLEVVPPQTDEGPQPEGAADWDALFAASGLNAVDFQSVPSQWVPSNYADTRLAWEGSYADAPEYRVRVEAASLHGRPVYFSVLWPWNPPLRAQPFEDSAQARAGNLVMLALGIAGLSAGIVLARRNLRLGRVDRSGALHLAAFVFAASLVGSLLASHHVPRLAEEWTSLTRQCGAALFSAGFVWLGYIALEPLVRRRWPESIISWARLLSGRLGDPLVGRDLLVGVGSGLGLAFLSVLTALIPGWLGQPPAMPEVRDFDLLASPAHWLGKPADLLVQALTQALVLMIVLVLLRTVLPVKWLSTLAFFAIVMLPFALFNWDAAGPYALPLAAVAAVLCTVVILRFGLVSLAAAFFVFLVFVYFPIGAFSASERDRPGLFVLLLVVALIAYAARAALAGRSLFEFGAGAGGNP